MNGKSIKSAPKNGTKIDLYLEIYASPLSMGLSDQFWIPHCWWSGKKWVHMYRGNPTELDANYITRWAPDGTQETDYREV